MKLDHARGGWGWHAAEDPEDFEIPDDDYYLVGFALRHVDAEPAFPVMARELARSAVTDVGWNLPVFVRPDPIDEPEMTEEECEARADEIMEMSAPHIPGVALSIESDLTPVVVEYQPSYKTMAAIEQYTKRRKERMSR